VVLSLTEFRHCAEVVLDHARDLAARSDLLLKEIGNTEPVCSDEADAASPPKHENDGPPSGT
jgi:hypothetical protein